MKILYVEDNPQDADLLQRFLAENVPDIQVEIVETQAEAENQLGVQSYDLVLTDLKLPQGDGLSLLASIREKELPVAVVVITGRGDEESVIAALHAGADDYLIKGQDYLKQLPKSLADALRRFHNDAVRKSQRIHVLYVEHNPADIDLAQRHVKKVAPHIQMDSSASGSVVFSQEIEKYDLLLLDYRMPGMNALEILKHLRQSQKQIPVVLITGHGEEEIALQALKLGASDYIVKSEGYLYRLPHILENAFYQYQLAIQEARFRSLYESVPVGLYRTTLEGVCMEANPALVRMLGYASLEDLQNLNVSHHYKHPQDRLEVLDVLEKNGQIVGFVTEFQRQDGSALWVEIDARLIPDEADGHTCLQGAIKDITDRKQAEVALNQHIADIEHMNEIYIGRENRMIDLKQEVNTLLKELGRPPKYVAPGQVDTLRGDRQ